MAGRSTSPAPTPHDGDAPGTPPADSHLPRVAVELGVDGVGRLNGREIHAADGEQIRALLIHLVIDMAVVGKTPVVAEISEQAGTFELLVEPDGTVTDRTRPDPTPPDQAVDAPRRPVRTTQGQWYIGPVGYVPATDHDPSTDVARDNDPDDDPGNGHAPALRHGGQLALRAVRLTTGSSAVVPVLRPPDGDTAGPDPAQALRPTDLPAASTPNLPAVLDPYPAGRALVDVQAQSVRGRGSGHVLRTAALGMVAVIVPAAVAVLVIDHGQDARPVVASSTRPTSWVVASASAAPAPSSRPAPATIRPAPLAAAPVGFAAAPVWGLGVDPDTKIGVGAGGLVYARTPEGTLTGINAQTGDIAWTVPGSWGPEWDGPHTGRIDGHDVVALVGADQVLYWPQPAGPTNAGQQVGQPTAVPIPEGARVTWAGPSPLVEPEGGGGAVIRGGRVQQVPLPAGARPLAADDDVVIAVQGSQWIRGKLGHTPTVRAIPSPRGISGGPARVEAVGSELLIAVWPKSAQPGLRYVLLETQSGGALVQRTTDPALDAIGGGVVRQLGGTMTAVGPLVVDTERHLVHELLPKYRVVALTSGHVLAAADDSMTDIGLTARGGFDVRPYPHEYPAASTPFAAIRGTGRSTALALVKERDQCVLVALPGT
jgi:hypothetical protein